MLKTKILLLAAKPWKMDNGDRGVSIHYLAEDSTSSDFIPIKASVDEDLYLSISKRPAVYEIEMSLKSQGGKAILSPISFKFVKDVDIKSFLIDAGK